ncbi:MaoC family dehydratase N-terminal domain-containing protein [Hydrogenophaga aromaticivorans]|jgi:acyl dehydratase|uniref:MaoC family dehydratase n=1 Tax=Hydrogenophaga aromaticivorans TaxID=2610898 RepID=A0A7Y8GUG6_9BURK|nr:MULTISPECIES: MaoC family dehydratase N-terminal domain-containing protein [Hydrogenophaga]EWS65463.1 (3R)-hydroxyacyl-ACP dehydratase subunit HadA [Hydrogenophaga sp. T4]MBU4183106.1 MaoC family dehydratase N-terminal domain-containing protein [Gammaproteobacteria bacterium]MBQ0921608.1 MaoC family dehydratase N-terminal domain-containing protein [Hydrogenophaga aromaticivorans]MBU4282533.1 MaoC family dehydratase N-terminal domain-containing protein [Gammaproteobacteria bacterium]MBU43254
MIDKQFIGYEVPPTLWDVEKGRIRFFAEVIGATDPIYFDASAAQAAGYRNVVAPPTFIFGAESDSGVLMTLLDTLKIDLRKVLHGEQRFDYHAPVCAGDTLRFQTRVTDIYDKKGGALEFVVNDTKVTNQLGEHVSDLHSVVVVRHA